MKSLKFLRRELGLSQMDLAMVSGVPRARIQLSEQGILPLKDSDLIKIAKVLKVDVAALNDWEGGSYGG